MEANTPWINEIKVDADGCQYYLSHEFTDQWGKPTKVIVNDTRPAPQDDVPYGC